MISPEKKAEELFNEHYSEIQKTTESELSEEILISVLAIKHALITVREIKKYVPSDYWNLVAEELRKI